jgi:hypothetical protein
VDKTHLEFQKELLLNSPPRAAADRSKETNTSPELELV